jgi:hypothetical protein
VSVLVWLTVREPPAADEGKAAEAVAAAT